MKTIEFTDFRPAATTPGNFLVSTKHEPLTKTLEKVNAWVCRESIEVVNIETLLLPNLDEDSGHWFNEGTEINHSHSARIRTAGEVRSHWYQVIRVWHWTVPKDSVEQCAEPDQATALALLDRAFHPSSRESQLCRRILNDSSRPHHAFVYRKLGAIVGFALYSQVLHDTKPVGFALYPIAVDPDHQGQGVGSRLLRQSLESPQLAKRSVFVVGPTTYFERFGFRPAPNIECPFDRSGATFRALRWVVSQSVYKLIYHPALYEPTS